MQTKDGYLMVGAAGEAIWVRCVKAFGHPGMVRGPAFCNQPATHGKPLCAGGRDAVLTTKTTEHWIEVLEAAGVPCGPVHNYARMFDDPQVRHRGLVKYANDSELGEVPHIRTPVRIGEGMRVRTVAPKLGQHNAEIFARLGVGDAEIKELRAKGVL
jgi:crotonobetainyl-CoA:carnitine CoA-transferase CaiB-like acyl-CoA transferase